MCGMSSVWLQREGRDPANEEVPPLWVFSCLVLSKLAYQCCLPVCYRAAELACGSSFPLPKPACFSIWQVAPEEKQVFSDVQQLDITKRFLRDRPSGSGWLTGWWLRKRFPKFLSEGVGWRGRENHILATQANSCVSFSPSLTRWWHESYMCVICVYIDIHTYICKKKIYIFLKSHVVRKTRLCSEGGVSSTGEVEGRWPSCPWWIQMPSSRSGRWHFKDPPAVPPQEPPLDGCRQRQCYPLRQLPLHQQLPAPLAPPAGCAHGVPLPRWPHVPPARCFLGERRNLGSKSCWMLENRIKYLKSI